MVQGPQVYEIDEENNRLERGRIRVDENTGSDQRGYWPQEDLLYA